MKQILALFMIGIFVTCSHAQTNLVTTFDGKTGHFDAVNFPEGLILDRVMTMAITFEKDAKQITESLFVRCKKDGKHYGLTLERRPYSSVQAKRHYHTAFSKFEPFSGSVPYVALEAGPVQWDSIDLWRHLEQHANHAHSTFGPPPGDANIIIAKWYNKVEVHNRHHKILAARGFKEAPPGSLPGISGAKSMAAESKKIR